MFKKKRLKGRCTSIVPLAVPSIRHTINYLVAYLVDYHDVSLHRRVVPDDYQIRRIHSHC